jgi:hypothetical protein
LNEATYTKLITEIEEIRRMLIAFIQHLKKRH